MAATMTAHLAVLIDADNAQPAIIDGLVAEIAKYGIANVKRIYGDWTGTRLKGWKDVLLTHSIQPIQQFGYTTGKNATDSAMIIDAMDLLFTGRFDGFCIVSSDSDFTRLAARIRESGLPSTDSASARRLHRSCRPVTSSSTPTSCSARKTKRSRTNRNRATN